jgi:hypothetical protein
MSNQERNRPVESHSIVKFILEYIQIVQPVRLSRSVEK